jgi:hypothetical protein
MMNTTRSRYIAIIFALGCLPAPGAQETTPQSQKHADVSWVFDVRLDRADNPRNKVFLVVGGRRVLLLANVPEGFRILDRDEYSSHDVPASAITACSGWWAGQGKDMYVIRRNRRLLVYIRDVEEGGGPGLPYRRLRVISRP